MKRWRFGDVCGAFALVFLFLAAVTTMMVFRFEDTDWRPRLLPMAMLAVVLASYALTYMTLVLSNGGFAGE